MLHPSLDDVDDGTTDDDGDILRPSLGLELTHNTYLAWKIFLVVLGNNEQRIDLNGEREMRN